MGDTLDTRDVPEPEQEQLRAQVRALMAAEGKAMTVVSKEIGLAYATFTAWLAGTYAGDNAKQAQSVGRWLNSRTAASRTRAVLPTAPDFILTPTAEAIQAVLEHCQHAPDMGMISGGPGIGKTEACRAYSRANSNVWIMTAEPCFSTPRMLLDCLADTVSLTEKYSSQKVSRAIQARLRGSGGLLIVDEAQHLSVQSLDQLRTLHDLATIGVALVGNEMVPTRMEGEARRTHFAQLYSRLGMRIARARPGAADIALLLDAWKIEGDAERRLLTAIARKPGALRGMTKTLRLAHMQALAHGKPVGTDTINAAWSRVSHTPIGDEAAA